LTALISWGVGGFEVAPVRRARLPFALSCCGGPIFGLAGDALIARLECMDNMLTYLKHHITNAVTERAELENPKQQIYRPGLPQFQILPDAHPLVLRKV
jgi:hypothetical protein